MPKLKREIFLRPTRFTHKFGERDDPLMPSSQQVFSMEYPKFPDFTSPATPHFCGKDRGLHVNVEPFSPVAKNRGGNASLAGPMPDLPDAIGNPIPPSTEMRRTQGALIKSEKKAGDIMGKKGGGK